MQIRFLSLKTVPSSVQRHLGIATLLTVLQVSPFAVNLQAQDSVANGELVFSDDFDRQESQEEVDEVGNGWKTNHDKAWSKGKKQADLRDGALHIEPSDGKESKLLVIRPCDFINGTIEFRFLLKKPNDALGIVIADTHLKNVHAGHVMSVRVQKGSVVMSDMLSGAFDPEIWKRKKANALTEEDKKQIAACRKRLDAEINVDQWHRITMTAQADKLSVSIDNKRVGDFRSPGFAHRKTILRLSVQRFGALDDFKLFVADSK